MKGLLIYTYTLAQVKIYDELCSVSSNHNSMIVSRTMSNILFYMSFFSTYLYLGV